MDAKYQKYILKFKNPSGTSRGILTEKETFFLEISDKDKKGIGECGIFRGLSYDDIPDYEKKLKWLCENIKKNPEFIRQELMHYPSIWFGYEQAMINLNQEKNIYFPSEFTKKKQSIVINGLIWMGNVEFIKTQIQEKLNKNFRCIKLKVGINWDIEKKILHGIREIFPKEKLEIRVDANGAFSVKNAKIVLDELYDLDIHSIEQPIKAGNWKDMANLCKCTPTPIALDEELIGVIDINEKTKLIESINPQYIILKPSLIGGFSGTNEWINLARELKIPYWITSALESNIGLNAISQYTFTKISEDQSKMPQGLGTGAIFTNNTKSCLEVQGDQLWFSTNT